MSNLAHLAIYEESKALDSKIEEYDAILKAREPFEKEFDELLNSCEKSREEIQQFLSSAKQS